jgi:hypothetical protein
MENEPKDTMDIQLNGEPFEVNRRNTSLFTFIGANACKDHVFIVLEDNADGTVEGTHIFEADPNLVDAYTELAGHIQEHDYPMHLNLNDVSQIDEDAFEAMLSRQFLDLSDYVPEDFKLSTEDENGNTA